MFSLDDFAQLQFLEGRQHWTANGKAQEFTLQLTKLN